MQMDVKEGYTLPWADHLLLSLSTPASFLPLKAPDHRGYSFDPLVHEAATVTASFSAVLTDFDLKKGRRNKPNDLQPGFSSFLPPIWKGNFTEITSFLNRKCNIIA